MSSITVRAYPPVVKYFALAVSRIGKRLNACKALHFLPDSRPSLPLPDSTAPAQRLASRRAGNDAVSVSCRLNCRFGSVAALEPVAPWLASALWLPQKANPGTPNLHSAEHTDKKGCAARKRNPDAQQIASQFMQESINRLGPAFEGIGQSVVGRLNLSNDSAM